MTRALAREAMSDPVRTGGVAYGRGTEQVGGTHYSLDMTPLGRQEDWEEPRGRAHSLRPRADQPGAGQTTTRR
jgi:predicted dithiol-disulfide oxidoreductase (DUF899 family)